jgi:hypothetical protein
MKLKTIALAVYFASACAFVLPNDAQARFGGGFRGVGWRGAGVGWRGGGFRGASKLFASAEMLRVQVSTRINPACFLHEPL